MDIQITITAKDKPDLMELIKFLHANIYNRSMDNMCDFGCKINDISGTQLKITKR